ncbi:MAG: amidohydrolase [Deltaproteobacteria bacterium]|nr:amidohydrolase [Deltaproteobacteria bacterium]
MSLLIKNGLLDGMRQDVFIDGNRFSVIGPNLGQAADEVIDASNLAILPGLANAHTHAAMTLLRGYADDMELHSWLAEHIWPFEVRMTEEDVYTGTRLACLEMIKSGTTFFADMYWHLPGIVRAVSEMGLRARLSGDFIDMNDSSRLGELQSRISLSMEASRDWPDRLGFCLGPHSIYTVSRQGLEWARDYSATYGLFVQIHVSETKGEVDDCLAAHGCRPVEYLYNLGLLGPQTILVHAIWLDGRERDLLAASGASLAHCPVSNMKLCSGAFPFRDFLHQNVNVALGTDGCSSNNNLDMFEEMKFSALWAKYQLMNPTAVTAEESFRAATRSGYRAFGLDGGEIAVGELADCILVDLDHPALVPNHNLISNLVYSAHGDCVDTTICDGRILMRGRKVDGEAEIVGQARARVKALTN